MTQIPTKLNEELRTEMFDRAREYSEKIWLKSVVEGSNAEADFVKDYSEGATWMYQQLAPEIEKLLQTLGEVCYTKSDGDCDCIACVALEQWNEFIGGKE